MYQCFGHHIFGKIRRGKYKESWTVTQAGEYAEIDLETIEEIIGDLDEVISHNRVLKALVKVPILSNLVISKLDALV